MGGMIEYGVSVSTKSSPRSVAIEKAQEELRWATDIRFPCIFLWMVEYGWCMTYSAIMNFRQEYDVREERRRELEFLEKVSLQVIFQIGYCCSLALITPIFYRVATH